MDKNEKEWDEGDDEFSEDIKDEEFEDPQKEVDRDNARAIGFGDNSRDY